MLQKAGNKTYKSPLHKLSRFFEQSRDGWKKKHGNVKKQNKSLQNRVRYLEKSKDNWKQEALQLREELSRLHSQSSKSLKLYEEEKKKALTKL